MKFLFPSHQVTFLYKQFHRQTPPNVTVLSSDNPTSLSERIARLNVSKSTCPDLDLSSNGQSRSKVGSTSSEDGARRSNSFGGSWTQCSRKEVKALYSAKANRNGLPSMLWNTRCSRNNTEEFYLKWPVRLQFSNSFNRKPRLTPTLIDDESVSCISSHQCDIQLTSLPLSLPDSSHVLSN